MGGSSQLDLTNEIAYGALICSFTNLILSFSRIILSHNPYVMFTNKIKLLLMTQLVSLFLWVTLLLALFRFASKSNVRLLTQAAIIYIFTLIFYLLIEVVLGRFEDVELHVVSTQEVTIIDTNAYLAAVRWLLSPLLLSATITTVTYFMSSYQNSFVNHATVLGLYLGIFVILKSRVEYQKKALFKSQK